MNSRRQNRISMGSALETVGLGGRSGPLCMNGNDGITRVIQAIERRE